MSKDMDSIEHWQHPSRIWRQRRVLDQAEGARRLVRQSHLARELGVTDKRIATWRSRRAVNGFPEAVACNIGPVRDGGKRRHLLWDLGECRAWFARYNEADQRARRGPYQRSRP